MKSAAAESAPLKKRAAPEPSDESDGDELGRLSRLGFDTLPEVLLSIPKGYYDYTAPIRQVKDEHLEKQQYVIVTFRGLQLFDENDKITGSWQNARRLELTCVDDAGANVLARIYGAVFPWRGVEPDMELHLFGKLFYNNKYETLVLSSPHLVAPHLRGKVVAQYAGKPGQVSGEKLREGVERALARLDEAEVHLLAQAGLRESEFTEATGAKTPQGLLLALHKPSSVVIGRRAAQIARTLAADTVVRRAAAARMRPPIPGSSIVVSKSFVEELIADLPHTLTADQRTSIDDIVNDLRSPYAMKRLLSGDVGTGKSLTFMVPAVAAYQAGAEVALLVPSVLLVDQMAADLEKYFPGLPVCKVVSKAGAKTEITEGIVVGTTALLNAAKKAKKKFNLVITDEQHKFSREQKEALADKNTNCLEATATAIPRTLALVNFGGMDVSVLRQCPVKKVINTRIVPPALRARADEAIAAVLAGGGQVAVIYPLVNDGAEGTVTEGLESVVGEARKWERKFPNRVGVLHGKLDAAQKSAVIEGMGAKKFDILVSSLVIEVGVTLPSLKLIVINHPERFGLAQLHQLRGRVARKGGTGAMFLMIGSEVDDEAMDRLQMLVECSDGFKLAEADMDIRGFGDVTEDSGSQTGASRTLFYNSQLTHSEITASAKRLGVKIDGGTANAAPVAALGLKPRR